MSGTNEKVTSLHLKRAERAADKIIDQAGIAIDTLQGVRLMLCLAYHEGVMDGSEDTVSVLRAELAKMA